MRMGEIRQFYKVPEGARILVRAAVSQLKRSPRAYHRIPKLARTIADLAEWEEMHIWEMPCNKLKSG